MSSWSFNAWFACTWAVSKEVLQICYILHGKVNLQGSYNYKKTLVYWTVIKAEELLGIMPIIVSQPTLGIFGFKLSPREEIGVPELHGNLLGPCVFFRPPLEAELTENILVFDYHAPVCFTDLVSTYLNMVDFFWFWTWTFFILHGKLQIQLKNIMLTYWMYVGD